MSKSKSKEILSLSVPFYDVYGKFIMSLVVNLRDDESIFVAVGNRINHPSLGNEKPQMYSFKIGKDINIRLDGFTRISSIVTTQ